MGVFRYIGLCCCLQGIEHWLNKAVKKAWYNLCHSLHASALLARNSISRGTCVQENNFMVSQKSYFLNHTLWDTGRVFGYMLTSKSSTTKGWVNRATEVNRPTKTHRLTEVNRAT